MNKSENQRVLDSLVGDTVVEVLGIKQYSEEVRLRTSSFREFVFFHVQDCCEHVRLEEWDGDPQDLVGARVLFAEEATNSGSGGDTESYGGDMESYTWTFYRIGTDRGVVTLRFLGDSNGYYSEEVTVKDVSTEQTRAEALRAHLESTLTGPAATQKRSRL